MNDKDLIKKLQGLKEIKPSQDWASLLKRQIVGEQSKTSVFEVFPRMFFQRRLAYATISVFAVVLGVVGFAQYTVPGDFLFSVKKATERSQGALLASGTPSEYNLDIVNRRMEELAGILKDNKTGNVDSAVQEIKDGIAQAIKDIPANVDNFASIAPKIQKIQRTKRDVEVLGVIMLQESNQLNDALAPLVANEIKALDQATNLDLTQQRTLDEIKAHYEKGEYTAALEKILLITNSK
ncbi:MAG: DUF5667 domain-containing protein [Candidatus Staskawiczbacteria bacterium]|jgi:hypothetical protein